VVSCQSEGHPFDIWPTLGAAKTCTFSYPQKDAAVRPYRAAFYAAGKGKGEGEE